MFTEVSIITIENENKLSIKIEAKIEVKSMKSALFKISDAGIQKKFDRAFEDFQRSTLNQN